MFDCHAHLQDKRLDDRREVLCAASLRAGVTRICSCGTSPQDWSDLENLLSSSPLAIHPCFGVHPWYAAGLPPDWLPRLETVLRRHPSAGVGEIGMDGIRQVPVETQQAVIQAQLELAARLGRPVVIHGAKAWGRVIEALHPFANRLSGILIHGFGGAEEVLRQLLALGAYISFGGSACNPHASNVHAAIKQVPDDRLLIETDSPDLFPFGGTLFPDEAPLSPRHPLNQPANLLCIANSLAKIKGVPLETIAAITESNALRFFASAGSGKI